MMGGLFTRLKRMLTQSPKPGAITTEGSETMKTVRQLANEIVAREGGYVNDPSDPGGATKYGVTIHTMRRLGLDLTGNGVINEWDVKALTRTQAVDIFVDEYFKRPKLHLLPEALQPAVFDMYVNSGSNAVKILQRCLNAYLPQPLDVDGGMGPLTAGAAYAVEQEIGEIALRDSYGDFRREYYYGIGDIRWASRKYARTIAGGKGGWILRAEEFMSPKRHLTLEQHYERTKHWP